MKSTILIFLQFVLLLFQITNSFAEESDVKSDYSIGAILPLSGPLSALGLASRKGIDLAVKEVNLNGGINNLPLKVFYEDSGGDPAKALSAFHKLSSDINVPVIVTGLTSVSQALKKPAEEKGIILFAESSLKGILNESKLMMRNFTDSEIFYGGMREYLKSRGIKKIAVVRAAEEWAKGAFDSLTSNNDFTVLADETVVKDSADVKPELLRIKSRAKEAEIVLLLVLGSVQAIVINQIPQIGLKLPLLTTYLCSQPTVYKTVFNNFDGQITFEGIRSTESPEYKRFLVNYKNDYSEPEPEFAALSEYDTVIFLAEVLKQDFDSASEIKQHFIQKKTFHGVLGLTEFNSEGDAVHKGIPMIFKNGTCHPKI